MQRCALGTWFCTLALLGLTRAWLAWQAAGAAGDGGIASIWLWGSLLLLAIGLGALVPALRGTR